MSPAVNVLKFGDNLGVTDEGGGIIRVDATGASGVLPTAPIRSTTPPSNPVDGQLWYYPATTATIWLFRYNAAPTGYSWEFVGGPPLRAEATARADFGNAWTEFAPSIGIARIGTYDVRVDWSYLTAPNVTTITGGFCFAGGGSALYASATTYGLGYAGQVSLVPTVGRLNIPAGTQLNSVAHGGASGASFYTRAMTVSPISIN